jgi:predicted nicotinamide N-methyase
LHGANYFVLRWYYTAYLDVDPKNVSLFAHHVWKASILLAKHLLNTDLSNKQVIELGAGSGLPSIIASTRGATVTASDYPDPALLKRLELNLEKYKIPVYGHIWGTRGDVLFPNEYPVKNFDVLLIADTLWMRHQHQNLLEDIRDLLKPGGVCVGVCGLHTGLDVVLQFFESIKNYGLTLVYLEKYKIPVGNGFSENEEWPRVPDNEILPTDPVGRLRYLIKFELKKIEI